MSPLDRIANVSILKVPAPFPDGPRRPFPHWALFRWLHSTAYSGMATLVGEGVGSWIGWGRKGGAATVVCVGIELLYFCCFCRQFAEGSVGWLAGRQFESQN